ncbi:cholinesterase-like [Amblyomma americanum]
MVMGMALAIAGIIMGLLLPGPKGGCPPLDKPLQDGTVMVATGAGRLIGRTITVDGARLSRFLGVSFAESTAGERRFALPVPLAVSSPCHLRDCLEPRDPCAQMGPNDSLVGSEDCLHANVWAPEAPPSAASSRALVVALDGDMFQTGSNDHPDWPQLAAKGDVVVVAPNHRLGVLGFLHPPDASGDKDVALDDLMTALHWARDNAAAFHADPNHLVVVGRGSGAYLLSAALRLLPNDTARRALYHGLVFGSLLPLEPADRAEPFRQLADALHCNSTEKSAWLPCFRAAPVEQLLAASRASRLPLRFAPRLDLDTLLKPAAAWPHTVLAGSDSADVRTLFTETILPLAKEANALTAEAVLEFAMGVFNIPALAKPIVRSKLQSPSIEEMARRLPHLVALCPTLHAAQAVPEGFHYHYDSVAASASFRPPLGVGQVAQFAAKGTVPPLGYGSPWPPLRTAPKTRVIEENNRENFTSLDAGCKL